MITNDLMFNDHTLNIFTDASIRKMPDGEVIGCAGANIIVGSDAVGGVIEQDTRIIRNSTSNNSEINAVKLGIEKALKYRGPQFTTINLISDSKLCIYGLREWIFNWIDVSVGECLIGSTNQEVANQDVILNIIYMILDNQLSINFYHQKGHVTYSPSSMNEAKQLFMSSNFLTHDVDMELIKNISIANNAIDKLTRCIVNNNSFGKVYPTSIIRYFYQPFDVKLYAQLINVRR
jgi:ribonuclease HI